MSLAKDANDAVVAAYISDGSEDVCVASQDGNLMCFEVWTAPVLKGAGQGVLAIKLKPDDRVFAFALTTDRHEGPVLVTALGRDEVVRPSKYTGSRGGRGHLLFRRGQFALWKRPAEIKLPKVPDSPTLFPSPSDEAK